MVNEKAIICIATLDTKGNEMQYIKNIINSKGHNTIIIDSGTLNEPTIKPDITREEILKAANSSLEELRKCPNANEASQIIIRGLSRKVCELYQEGRISGVISIGGSTGSNIGSSVMKELPVGIPKVLVSTKVAQAGAREYVGTKDIMIMPSVADIEGLNRITKKVLANAAGAVCGMIEAQSLIPSQSAIKGLVAMSMLGTTTECGLSVKTALEKLGYEVVIFHAVGTGGKALEEFVREELVNATIELGINEVGNDLLGGLATAGPDRLESAGKKGILQIITPGHVNVIQFLGLETIPDKYKNRNIYVHSPVSTAMQLNNDELVMVAKKIAEKLNKAKGTVKVIIPTRGFSSWDEEGKHFYNPEGDQTFIKTLKGNLKKSIYFLEVDAHINDKKFSETILEEFLKSSR